MTEKTTGTTGGAVVIDEQRALGRARDLCAFIDAAPMPFQAAAECARRLDAAGFEELSEADPWKLTPGRGRYTLRNGSTLIAFVPGKAPPSRTGIAMVGAHLDSPNLRVKPVPDLRSHGWRQLGVEVYGGPILATWVDRDLGLAGRVVLAGRSGWPSGRPETRLVTIPRPVARVATLAIHLARGVNEEGLRLDKQRHMVPLLGLDDTPAGEAWTLRRLLAGELSVAPERIVSFDLGLFDVTPSAIGGIDGELLFAPRLDNLGSSHAGLLALVEAAGSGTPGETSWLLVLYDHEECGSQSSHGAMGTFVRDVVSRLVADHPGAGDRPHDEIARALARSFLVSADMAHAVHPNFPELHEPSHRPRLNRGPVIKRNENQRYATDGESAAVFTRLCRDAGFEPQHFVSRSDLPCGTTIGPIASAGLGLETVDVGNPMLSMHSARELAGAYDQDLMVEAMRRLFV